MMGEHTRGRPDAILEKIQPALKTLTYREREIIKLRYGLTPEGNTYSQPEVARIFKVTIGRVRSLEEKALKKLDDPTRAAIAKAKGGWTMPEPTIADQALAQRLILRFWVVLKPGETHKRMIRALAWLSAQAHAEERRAVWKLIAFAKEVEVLSDCEWGKNRQTWDQIVADGDAPPEITDVERLLKKGQA